MLDSPQLIALKGCPRCGGALYANSDIYGPYIGCLMCGFQQNMEREVRHGRSNVATPAGRVV